MASVWQAYGRIALRGVVRPGLTARALRAVARALPLLLLLPAGLAAPAAAETYEPPEGCTGYLTVQSKDCRVSNHYTCAGDPEGHRWRLDFAPSGPFHGVLIDAETQWLEMHDRSASGWDVRRLQTPAPDPASMKALLANGTDTYRFTVSGAGPRESETFSGFDLLTGTETVIDGVRLLDTEFTAVVTDADGAELRRVEGFEYVHPEYRHFIGGVARVTRPGEETESFDGSPVSFVLPGEPGFFTTRPAYGCVAEQSDAGWRPQLGGAPHE